MPGISLGVRRLPFGVAVPGVLGDRGVSGDSRVKWGAVGVKPSIASDFVPPTNHLSPLLAAAIVFL
jgi:hypothetical protein